MAVSFMPDQRERNGQFFSLGFINGNGQGDQLTLVELIIVMAVVWRRGDVVMAGCAAINIDCSKPGRLMAILRSRPISLSTSSSARCRCAPRRC